MLAPSNGDMTTRQPHGKSNDDRASLSSNNNEESIDDFSIERNHERQNGRANPDALPYGTA